MRERILVLTLLLLAVPCRAEIIIVDDDGPADFNNIQAAIDDSNDWDTIYVLPGIYTGPGNRDIDFLGKAITVQSVIPEDPYIVAATIIDCDANASDTHRGFLFLNAEDANSVLNGLTITNGYASKGGGIYCYLSSPTITNCVIKDNAADGGDGGGGIYCSRSSPTITNCVIKDNTADGGDGAGGGIYCYRSSPTITNCVIKGNTADGGDGGGGGIYCYLSSPTITNCVIKDNTAYGPDGGGGIRCGGGSPAITNCVIKDNTAYGSDGGGGIRCGGGSPTITNCVIEGNAAGGIGGGGISCDGSRPIITNCAISYNSSSYKAGGIYYYDSSVNVNNCTFTGNSAATSGGAIEEGWRCTGSIVNCTFAWNTAGDGGGALASCTGRISNCIFTANSAGDKGGALHDCIAEISNCVLSCNWAAGDGGGAYTGHGFTNCTFTGNSAGGDGGGIFMNEGAITNCILWGNTDSSGTGESAQIGSEPSYVTFSCIQDDDPNDANIPFGGTANNNIDDNPMFVRDPNDGGDGWGDDPCTPDANEGQNDDFGDQHLQNSSPCINTGDPSFSIGPNAVDIDGEARVMGFIVDMGADEFFMPAVLVTKPEGGEVWVGGSSHEIVWDSDLYEGPVDILLSMDAGSDWETVESNLPDTGSYMWHLPDIVDSNQCLISVEPNVPDPNVVCINSGLFTIHPDFLHPEVPSKWKSLGGDFKRAGLSQNYGPQLGCVKWQFETEGAVSASITVGADDRVHIACEDGRVYTLDIGDGSLLWSYDTNSPLLSAPTVGPRGSVYVGSENGKLYAISIGGTLRWTHSTGGLIYSSPAVSEDGNIYVGSQDGVLHALGQDGSELWTFKIAGSGIIEGAILASPAIGADGTVYIAGLYDPNLYA
ncbi:MAG: right-handed parallel beta-helix repeat-containing protein, partial [Planctomycetota bacterium]